MRGSVYGIALVVFGLTACGGEPRTADTAATGAGTGTTSVGASGATSSGQSTVAASQTTPQAPTGKMWDVKMLGDEKGYRFEPANLTIKTGDAVRWTVVSGPPHNVTFWPDSIPQGAASQLGANMAEVTSPLTGPLRGNPKDSYVVSFAGVPVGTYRYYCTPHLALGMKAVLTVQ